jgi:hypothetical protein
MKDKDFDEIGKRLYDMEADPPEDGWDKLYGGLRPVQPRGKLVSFRKHWWKPFVLIIPLATYYFISDSGNAEKMVTVSSTKTTEAARTPQVEDNTQEANSNSAPSGESQIKSDARAQENTEVQPTTSVLHEDPSSDKPTVAAGKNVEGRSSTLGQDNSTQVNKKASGQDNSVESSGIINGHKKTPIAEKPGEPAVSATVLEQSATEEKPVAENQKNNSIGKEAGAVIFATEAMTQTPQSKSKLTSSGGRPGDTPENLIAEEVADVDHDSDAETETTSINETTSTKKNSAFAGPPLAAGLSTTSANSQDSLATIAAIETDKIDSAAAQTKDTEERKESLSPWRVSLGITPQYVTKTVKPLPNDEVMMFVNSGNSEHAGLVASLGIGRAITNNFYLDLQFSLQKARQDISYSYSTTGAVDTLLAHRQADGTIIVSPVYELSTTEITTNYTYGAMRLTGTYYFLYNARGRFNLTAGAGLNSLLDAKIYENSNGEWVDVSDDYENKTNYSLSISGGYSFILRKGWELMVNPVLTYYPSNEQIRDLPFGVQRKSYGLNFTLLKNLRSRK